MNSNRRGFLKSMLAAAVGASILVPTFSDAHKWKRSAKTGLWVLNPEYVNAPYEVRFLFNPAALEKLQDNPCIVSKRGTPLKGHPMYPMYPWPPRYNENQEPVSPFIQI